MTRSFELSPAGAHWTKHPKARQTGIYWRLKNGRLEYGFLRPRGNVEYAGTSMDDAVAARSKALADDHAGKPAPTNGIRIRDLAEDVREAKKRTLRRGPFVSFEYALDKIILPEFGHLRPRDVTPDRIARYIRELERGNKDRKALSGASVRRYLSPLGAILGLAVRRGAIETNPLTLLRDDERPRQTPVAQYEWSPEDVKKLLAAVKAREGKQSYYPLVALLATTGMRVGEALALRWADVDLAKGELRITKSWDRDGKALNEPKTAAGKRLVPLPAPLVEILKEHKPFDIGDGWVFPSLEHDTPLSYSAFRNNCFGPALIKAGLAGKGITIHSLRHCAASALISYGISDVDVAAMLGHANANVTRAIYAHVFDRSAAHDQIREAMKGVGQ